jgi:hypothetical protein
VDKVYETKNYRHYFDDWIIICYELAGVMAQNGNKRVEM